MTLQCLPDLRIAQMQTKINQTKANFIVGLVLQKESGGSRTYFTGFHVSSGSYFVKAFAISSVFGPRSFS